MAFSEPPERAISFSSDRCYPARLKINPMPDDTRDERRQQPRVPLDARATIALAEERIAASTKDISERGLFFFTDAHIEVGSNIDILLMVPEEAGLPINGMVCCHGRVVRVAPSGGRYGMGMEIDGVEPASLL